MMLLGVVGIVTAIVALQDPAAAKMADDSDPYGPPVSLSESILIMATCGGISLLGWRVFRWNPGRIPRA